MCERNRQPDSGKASKLVSAHRPPASARFLAVTASLAFSVVLAGSVVSAPMLPLYRVTLQLSVSVISGLFSIYLVVLVAFFLVMMRTNLARFAWILLPAAVLLQIFASVAMWVGAGDAVWLFIGRASCGAAIGLGTGATATLAVAAVGERGRAVVATSAIAGAAFGMLASTWVTATFPRPDHLVYQLHIVVLVAVLCVLVVALTSGRQLLRTALPRSVGTLEQTERPEHNLALSARERFVAYGSGAAGWAAGGLAAGLIPSAMKDGFSTDAVVVLNAAPVLLLLTAWLSPTVFRALGLTLSLTPTMLLMALGGISIVTGLSARVLWLVVIGGGLWGLGQGSAYASGLRAVTHGLKPVHQGRTASGYAAAAYAFTAVLVLACGAIADELGSLASMAFAVVGLTVLCSAVAVLGRRRNIYY